MLHGHSLTAITPLQVSAWLMASIKVSLRVRVRVSGLGLELGSYSR